jgi:hypothetical protein
LSERNSCLKVPAIGTFTNKVNAIFTVFAEEAAKARWKGLRDNFRKEFKKQISLDRETVLHRRHLGEHISRYSKTCLI